MSEAATTAVDFLDRAFEVELVMRDRRLPFGLGRRHRFAILEALALVEPEQLSPGPLLSTDPGAPQVRLGMDPSGDRFADLAPGRHASRRRGCRAGAGALEAPLTYGREKRLLLGWLALVAPVPLPFNGILEWGYLLAYVVVCLLFLRRAARDPGGWLPTWAMNVVAVAYLPYFAFDLTVLSRGRLVVPVTHLLLFTVLVKLFALRRERDKWQTAIAIFFLFLTAMGTSVHPTVVLYLLVFVVLALLLFARFAQLHLTASFAGTELQRRELLDVPLRRFLAVAAVATVAVAVPLFVLLPRVESPFVPGRGQGLGTLGAATGFSDEVTLDTIGRIRTNREVAMRLRYDAGDPPSDELRFKGGAFEHYDHGVWRPQAGVRRLLIPSPRAGGAIVLDPAEPIAWVDVFLRPVTGRNIVLPVQAVRLKVDTRGVLIDDQGLVRRSRPASGTVEYRVGLAGVPVSKAQPAYGSGSSDRIEKGTLDLSGVSPRIADLAAEVGGEGSPSVQAARIQHWLMTEFRYTLDLVGSPERDPIVTFLFDRREGHCEYFATAMVLMLRSRGIPARLATGFLGAEYNPLEGYYVVRQSNAHAWVEAFLPDRGWTVFDPTPPAGRPVLAETGMAQILSQAWDYVIFRWDRYVLTYGFGQQMEVLLTLRRAWRTVWGWFGKDEDASAPGQGAPTIVDGGEAASAAAEGPRAGLSWWWSLLVLAVLAGRDDAALAPVAPAARRHGGLSPAAPERRAGRPPPGVVRRPARLRRAVRASVPGGGFGRLRDRRALRAGALGGGDARGRRAPPPQRGPHRGPQSPPQGQLTPSSTIRPVGRGRPFPPGGWERE